MEENSRAGERAAKRRHWREQFENWKQSGLTQAEYCRRHGLKHHQWRYWKKRLVDSPAPVKFIRLDLERFAGAEPAPCRSVSLRLTVGDGFRIEIDRGFDPATLVQLVRTLRRC